MSYNGNKKFPALPDGTHEWAPIYWEPIMGSGERITILIAVITDVGEICACPSFHPFKLRTVLGTKAARQIVEQVETILEDLEAHLVSEKSFDGWKPCLSGVFLGTIAKGGGRDWEKAVKAGVEFTSAFGEPRRVRKLHKEFHDNLMGTA